MEGSLKGLSYTLDDRKQGLGRLGGRRKQDSSNVWALLHVDEFANQEDQYEKQAVVEAIPSQVRRPPGGEANITRKIIEMAPVTPRPTRPARADVLRTWTHSTHFSEQDLVNIQPAPQDIPVALEEDCHMHRVDPQGCKRTLFQDDGLQLRVCHGHQNTGIPSGKPSCPHHSSFEGGLPRHIGHGRRHIEPTNHFLSPGVASDDNALLHGAIGRDQEWRDSNDHFINLGVASDQKATEARMPNDIINCGSGVGHEKKVDGFDFGAIKLDADMLYSMSSQRRGNTVPAGLRSGGGYPLHRSSPMPTSLREEPQPLPSDSAYKGEVVAGAVQVHCGTPVHHPSIVVGAASSGSQDCREKGYESHWTLVRGPRSASVAHDKHLRTPGVPPQTPEARTVHTPIGFGNTSMVTPDPLRCPKRCNSREPRTSSMRSPSQHGRCSVPAALYPWADQQKAVAMHSHAPFQPQRRTSCGNSRPNQCGPK